MKKTLLLISLLFFITHIQAQTFNYSLEKKWDAKPALHSVHKPYDSSGAVGILDERRIEYISDKDNLFINSYHHYIVKVMNDNGIEMFNKIYIPEYENSDIQNIQVRTIDVNGKVNDLNTDNIKEIEEDGGKYKLFAVEGLEKGSELEYAYTVKRNLSLFGSETFQRTNMPYLHAQFLLITPAYLKFDAKGYNGFMVSKDSLIGEQRVITGYSNDIDEMQDEKYAETDPFLQRVDYKLSYNLDKNATVRLYTWKEFAKNTYTYYTTRTPKEDKVVDAFAAKIKLPQSNNAAEKIAAVEDFVKNNINIDKDLSGDAVENLELIIKNKSANQEGAVRLFAGLFEKLSIDYQIVFPGTRVGYTLDEELEDWNRVNDIIFYFPATGKYLSPVSIDLRYPFIPYEFTAARALFLKGTTIGDFKTAIGTFAGIPAPVFDDNAINVEADITFDEDLDTVIIHLSQIFKGYGAEAYRPVYHFLTADKQEIANKQIIGDIAGSENISDIKVENTAFEDYFDNKPLIINSTIKNTELIENAGNKILFKVGALIGQQTQMYQEKPRHLPVALPFPHMLNRKIQITIPDSYIVKNPDDLNVDVEYKNNDTTTMGFVSSYMQKDNVITVSISETYHQINYPLSEFEDFKKVINASADFNKIVLVLQKK